MSKMLALLLWVGMQFFPADTTQIVLTNSRNAALAFSKQGSRWICPEEEIVVTFDGNFAIIKEKNSEERVDLSNLTKNLKSHDWVKSPRFDFSGSDLSGTLMSGAYLERKAEGFLMTLPPYLGEEMRFRIEHKK